MPALFNIKSSGLLSDSTTFGRLLSGTVVNGPTIDTLLTSRALSTTYARVGTFTLALTESNTDVCGLYTQLSSIKPTSTISFNLSSNGGTIKEISYNLSAIPALSAYSQPFWIGLMFDPTKFTSSGTALTINVSAKTSEMSGAFVLGNATTPDFNRGLISTTTFPITSALATERINIFSHLYDINATTYGELSGKGTSNVINISGEKCLSVAPIFCHSDSKIQVSDVNGGSLENTNTNFLTLNNSSSLVAGTLISPLTSNFVFNLSAGTKTITLNHSSNLSIVGAEKQSYTFLNQDTLPNISSIELSNFYHNISSWNVDDILIFPPNGKSKSASRNDFFEVQTTLIQPRILGKTNTTLNLTEKIVVPKLGLSTSTYGPSFSGAPIMNLTRNITFGPFKVDTATSGFIDVKDNSSVYIKNAELCRTNIYTSGSVVIENCPIMGTTHNNGDSSFVDIQKPLNVTYKNNIFFNNRYGLQLANSQTVDGIIKNITLDSNVFFRGIHPFYFGSVLEGNATKCKTRLNVINNIFSCRYHTLLINDSSIVSKFYNNISYFIQGAGLLFATRNDDSTPILIENYRAFKVFANSVNYAYQTAQGCGIDYRGLSWSDISETTNNLPRISCKNIQVVDCEGFGVYIPRASDYGDIDGLIVTDCYKGVYIRSNYGPLNINRAFCVRNNKTSSTLHTNIDATYHKSSNIFYDVGDCEFIHSIKNSVIGSAEDAIAINVNSSNFLDKLKIDNCDLYSSETNIFLCPEGYPNNSKLVKGSIVCSNTNFYYPTNFTFFSNVEYTPQTDGGSVAFDGINYIKPLSGNHFDFGTGDFTIDGWINPNDSKTLPILLDTRSSDPTKNGFTLGLNRTWYLEIKVGSNTYTSDIAIFRNLWYHFVLSRTSGVINLWLNGNKAGTFSDSTNFNSKEATIGATYDGKNAYNGYMFNLRINKGVSLYDVNQNFNPPFTISLPNQNTSLLLAAYNHNQIIDRLGKNEIISYGSALSSRDESKFGKGSIYFDGSDFGAITFKQSNNFSFGSSNFTIEGWIYSKKITKNDIDPDTGNTLVVEVTASKRAIFDLRTESNTASGFYLAENDLGFKLANSDNTFISTTSGRNSDTWQHFAVVRNGSTLTLFIDGLSSNGGSFDLTNENFSNANLIIGGYEDGLLSPSTYYGYIDNFIVTKDLAKYTSDFSPGPILLTDVESSFAGLNKNSFIDNSINKFITTQVGGTNIFGYSPKSEASNSYNESLHNGSLYFDTSVTLPSLEIPYSSTLFDWWTNDFTLEFFIYAPSFVSSTIADTDFTSLTNKVASNCIGNFSKNTTEFIWSFGPIADNTVTFVYQSVDSGTQRPQRIDFSQKLTINAWNHVALSKTSSGVRLYVNGIGSPLSAIQFSPRSDSNTPLTIGQYNNTKIADKTYISNLRIVKGTALYTTDTITVPTQALSSIPNTSLLIKATESGVVDSTGNSSLILRGNASNRLATIDTSLESYGNSPKTKKSYGIHNRILDVKNNSLGTLNGPTVEFISPFNGTSTYYVSAHGCSIDLNNIAALNQQLTGIEIDSTNFNNDNFVIDFFAYPTKLNASTIFTIASSDTSTTGFRLEQETTGKLKIISGNALIKLNDVTPNLGVLPLSTWSHVAISRNSNKLKVLKNGKNPFNIFDDSGYILKYGAFFDNPTPGSTTGRYLSIAGNTVLNFGLSDNFTVEAYINLRRLPTSDSWPGSFTQLFQLIGVGTPTTTNGIMFIIGQSKLLVSNFNDTTYPSNINHDIIPNKWYHIAYVRNGNTIYFYVNGIQKGSIAFPVTSIGVGATTYIGCETTQGAFFDGQISNLRVTKGAALYNGEFTPSTITLTTNSNGNATGTGLISPQPSQVTLLAFTTQNFLLDASTSNKTIISPSTVANIPTKSQILNINGDISCAEFVRSSSKHLIINNTNIINFAPTQDWTVECYVYLTSMPTSDSYSAYWNLFFEILGCGTKSKADGLLFTIGATKLVVSSGNGSSDTTYTSPDPHNIVPKTWNHIAFVKSSGNIRFYVNGIFLGSVPHSQAFVLDASNTAKTYIGTETAEGSYFDGYISNLRVTKDVALYPTGAFAGVLAFNPPTTNLTTTTNGDASGTGVLTPQANQVVLLTLQNETLIDNSINGFQITQPATSTQIPIIAKIKEFPFWILTNADVFTDRYLKIGNNVANNAGFQGYISNFRIRKGVDETSITIPTNPLKNDEVCDLLVNTFYDGVVQENSYNSLTSNDVYFDGTGIIEVNQERQAISINNSTIEMWVRFQSSAVVQTLLDTRISTADTSRFTLTRDANNKLSLFFTATNQILSDRIETNRWYHIAVITENSNISLYVNGIKVGNCDFSTNSLSETIPFRIGGNVNNVEYLVGRISNFTISKGTKYSENFIPSTLDISTDSNTIFALRHNTNIQRYTTIDKTNNTKLIYNNCIGGLSGRFGNNALSFRKPYYSYAQTFDDKQMLELTSAGSFCFEFWTLYPTSKTDNQMLAVAGDGITNNTFNGLTIAIYVAAGNALYIEYNNQGSATNIQFKDTVNLFKINDWNHIAFTYDGTTYRGFLNGKLLAIGSSTTGLKSAPNVTGSSISRHVLRLGRHFGDLWPYDGLIDEVRLTKGVARYTSDFSSNLPSATFNLNTDPDANKVVMLLKGDTSKVLEINDVFDSSSNNNIVYKSPGISQVDYSPFNPNGWSVYFNGVTTPSLTLPTDNTFRFDSSEFTLEFWFYKFSSNSSLGCMVDARKDTATKGLKVDVNSTDLLISGIPILSASVSFGQYIQNAWNHVAIVNTGNVFKIFLNGQQKNGDIDVGNTVFDNNIIRLGCNKGNTEFYVGLISNLRIIKGFPLYVTNFIPNKNELPSRIVSDLDINKTSLLIDCDTNPIINGDTIVDKSSNALTLTKTLTVFKSNETPYTGGETLISKPFNITEYQTDVFREKGIVNSYIGGNPKRHAKYLNAGSIQTDDAVFRNVDTGFSEKLTPNSTKTRLRSGSRLVALRAFNQLGNYAPDTLSKISVWIRKSSNWSGELPRLIVVENRSMGIYEDTVLAVASGANNTWIKLEATNVGSVKKNGMLEFYVDCIGVDVGSIWIDDWAQEII